MKISKLMGAGVALLIAGSAFAGAAAAQTAVTFGLPSKGFLHLVVYIAKEKGYLKDEGIDPEVIYLKGGSAAVNALISGGVDISIVDPTSAMHAHERGADVVAFGAEMRQYGSNVVIQGDIAKKIGLTHDVPPEERLKSLKGLRLGITGVGGTPDLLLRYLASRAGLDPDRDLTLVPLGDANSLLAAFKQKRIDGFALSSPTSDIAVSELGAFMVLHLATGEYKPLEGFPAETLLATKSWLDENPETAVHVVKAFSRALKLMKEDPEAAKEAVRVDFDKTDPKVFDAAFESILDAYPETMELSDEVVAKMLDFYKVTSGHEFKVDPKEFFLNKYVEEAKK